MDLRPTCVKCGETLDANNMKTVSFGKFACKSCHTEDAKEVFVENTTKVDDFFFDKTYQCGDCGFKFTRAPTFKVDNCPYCASTRVNVEIEEADNLVLH